MTPIGWLCWAVLLEVTILVFIVAREQVRQAKEWKKIKERYNLK